LCEPGIGIDTGPVGGDGGSWQPEVHELPEELDTPPLLVELETPPLLVELETPPLLVVLPKPMDPELLPEPDGPPSPTTSMTVPPQPDTSEDE
jgi:hypothetical protein